MSNELDFLVNDANATDQDTVRVGKASYPVIQWAGGDPEKDSDANVRYHGGWFCPLSTLDLAGVPGWTKSFVKKQDPKTKEWVEIEGFYAKSLHIAFVQERHRYEVGKGQAVETFSTLDYDAADARAKELTTITGKPHSARKRSHFFVALKGMEDQPVVLTVGGVFAKAISGRTGLRQFFDREFMGFVNQQLAKAGTNNKLPTRRFWIEVGVRFTDKGKPDFQTYGEGKESVTIVLPTCLNNLPSPMTMEYVKATHVGDTNRTAFDGYYEQAKEWANAWDKIKAGTKESNPEAAAATASNLDAETTAALNNM